MNKATKIFRQVLTHKSRCSFAAAASFHKVFMPDKPACAHPILRSQVRMRAPLFWRLQGRAPNSYRTLWLSFLEPLPDSPQSAGKCCESSAPRRPPPYRGAENSSPSGSPSVQSRSHGPSIGNCVQRWRRDALTCAELHSPKKAACWGGAGGCHTS